jgi:flagellar basal-body rod modification protein FlgD
MLSGLVTSSTSSTSASSTDSTSSSQSIGQDAFLQLLVAELKNQDPTNATDPNQMVSQMAQFSTLEQQTNTNSLLTSLQGQMSAIYQGQTASLLGKKVQLATSGLTLSGGTATVGLDLPSAAADVKLTIQNATGQTVATLDQGAMPAGNQSVTWNGKDASGKQLADGSYTVTVSATDASGNALTATTTATATITAVNFDNGTIMVTAGGQQYPLTSVTQVSS